MNKIDKIKELYALVPEKTKFISDLAEKLNKSPSGLRNNWFSSFWAIPKKHQDDVIRELEEVLKSK